MRNPKVKALVLVLIIAALVTLSGCSVVGGDSYNDSTNGIVAGSFALALQNTHALNVMALLGEGGTLLIVILVVTVAGCVILASMLGGGNRRQY